MTAGAWGFPSDSLAHEDATVRLWRCHDVLLVEVAGVIDDARSAWWRDRVDAHVAAKRNPTTCAVDFSGCEPQNSMAARYRSAAWGRNFAQRIAWASLFTGGSAGPSVVVRSALRLMGMGNIVLRADPREFEQDLAAMLRGERR